MESYTTIRTLGRAEYEDRKSVFIAESMPIANENEAIEFIQSVKKAYPDAKHHVYAYILRENSIMRFSDDREPQGTAGMPVLDSIRKNGCTDVCTVVVRYFGGTLLGTGGLVKAYSTAAVEALKNGEIITYDKYSLLSISVTYSDYQKILPTLSAFRTEDTLFGDKVVIKGKIRSKERECFEKKILDSTFGKAEITFLEEKYDF